MAGSKFSDFMSKGATAFASPKTRMVVLAAAVAVGATFAHVAMNSPETPFGAQLAATVSQQHDTSQQIIAEVGMPRFMAMRMAMLAGFGGPSMEIMEKLDPEVVKIIAEVKKSSGQEFSLMPLNGDGSVFTPKILKEIGMLAQERGVQLECTASYAGVPGCGAKLPAMASVVSPADLDHVEIAYNDQAPRIGM